MLLLAVKLNANSGHDLIANHWPLILIVVLLLILLTKVYTKASDKAKANHYIKKQNKAIKKQYHKNEQTAIRLINQIIGLLDQQMSYVDDPSQLDYFKEQYQGMREDLSNDQQVHVSAYDLYNQYVHNFNDTQSQLATTMLELTKLFRN